MHGKREVRCVICNRIKQVGEMQEDKFPQWECDECISKKKKFNQLSLFKL